jgi:hypothetical protein
MKKDLDSNIAEAPREWKKTFRSVNSITMRLPCFKDGHQGHQRHLEHLFDVLFHGFRLAGEIW